MRFKFSISPIALGIGPVSRRFPQIERIRKERIPPIVLGIDPVRPDPLISAGVEIKYLPRISRLLRLPKEGGIMPFIGKFDKNSSCSRTKFPILSGISLAIKSQWFSRVLRD
jgi:hypothetical protein